MTVSDAQASAATPLSALDFALGGLGFEGLVVAALEVVAADLSVGALRLCLGGAPLSCSRPAGGRAGGRADGQAGGCALGRSHARTLGR